MFQSENKFIKYLTHYIAFVNILTFINMHNSQTQLRKRKEFTNHPSRLWHSETHFSGQYIVPFALDGQRVNFRLRGRRQLFVKINCFHLS